MASQRTSGTNWSRTEWGMVMGHAPHPSMVCLARSSPCRTTLILYRLAENRGPGLGHVTNGWDEDNYELDMDQRTRDLGGRPGRIILLGDGKQVLTDNDEMDQDDDDPEAASHGINEEPQQTDEETAARSAREATPAPESSSEKPSTDTDSTKIHVANDSDMPTKLFNKSD